MPQDRIKVDVKPPSSPQLRHKLVRSASCPTPSHVNSTVPPTHLPVSYILYSQKNRDKIYAMGSIGAALPPHLLAKRKRAHEEDEHRDKVEKKTDSSANGSPTTISSSTAAQEKRRRVIGPALPPAPLEQMPKEPATNEDASDSSDDDDFGPALPVSPFGSERIRSTWC